MDIESMSSVRNEYDYLVALYGEARDFEQYLADEWIHMYDKDLNFVGWVRK